MLTSPCFFSSRPFCIASGRMWRTPWRRASPRRMSRYVLLGQPLADGPAAVCLAPLGAKLRGQSGRPTPLLAAGFALPQPVLPAAPGGSELGGHQEDSANLGLCLLARHGYPVSQPSLCQAPWRRASGKSLPKCPWEHWHLQPPSWQPRPVPLHWALSGEAERLSNWVRPSSWLRLWGVSGGHQ